MADRPGGGAARSPLASRATPWRRPVRTTVSSRRSTTWLRRRRRPRRGPQRAGAQGQGEGRLPADPGLRHRAGPQPDPVPRHPAGSVLSGVRRRLGEGVRRPVLPAALRPGRQGTEPPALRRLHHLTGRHPARPHSFRSQPDRRRPASRGPARHARRLRHPEPPVPDRGRDPRPRHLGAVHPQPERRAGEQRESRDRHPRPQPARPDPPAPCARSGSPTTSSSRSPDGCSSGRRCRASTPTSIRCPSG